VVSIDEKSNLLDEYFKEYRNVIKTFLNSDKKGLYVYGSSGKGKTFNTIKILEELKIKYELIKGYITPYKLYQKFLENCNNVIVLDDVASLLSDKDKVSILLGALDKYGKVVWVSAKNDIDLPEEFTFNGKVIIISNRLEQNNELQEAILDRCILYRFEIPRSKMIEMIRMLAKNDGCLEIVDWLDENKLDINFRDYETLRDIYKNNKKNWKDIAKKILLDNGIETVLTQITKADKVVWDIETHYSNLNLEDKISIFSEITGYKARAYYKHKKKLINLGLLKDERAISVQKVCKTRAKPVH